MTDATGADAGVIAPTGFRHAFSSLHHRDFALFWTAAAFSNTGSWMQTITVPYVIYAITGSTAWLGFAAFISFFPGVVIGPVSGAIADRFPRRTVLLVTQSIQMVVAFALWALWVGGVASPANILATLLVSAIAAGINITTWQAFVPALVPREDLLNAVRLNSVQFTAARAFGPALAGLVLARFGPGATFMANALSYLLVIAALFAVRPRPNPVERHGISWIRQFTAGVSYVRARPSLSHAVRTILVVSLLPSALVQLAPAFAAEQFHTSKAGYGFLVAAYGAGAIVGSVGIAAHADRFRRSGTTTAGLVGSVAGVLLLALSPLLGVGLLALALMGISYVAVTISLNTSIQLQVDEVFRGRAVSIYLMALLAGLPIGAMILGWVAELTSLRATMVGTAVALAVYAVVTVRAVGLRALDASTAAVAVP